MVLEVHYTHDYPEQYFFVSFYTSYDLPLFARNTELNLSVFSLRNIFLPPNGVVPVFLSCASQRDPLLNCLSQRPTSTSLKPHPHCKRKPPSASTHLPRVPLRKGYSAFLDAARDKLIDDITEASFRLRLGIVELRNLSKDFY